ncbi:hypothetical protein EDB83DRAFT_1088930 [Lactarius deliciosus]|nr:hypothetical protein EDB83DRAFT_1088930 [Lactarius deliciosus]
MTVFGFSHVNLFYANKSVLIISSVASAIGLFVEVWFILAYSGADVRKFQFLAAGLYGFALSSRLPLVAVFVAVLALVTFEKVRVFFTSSKYIYPTRRRVRTSL